MKSLLALLMLAAALAVGACNSPAGSAGTTLTPVSSPATSPATSPAMSPEVSASPS
jgi:ABC-type glycerol-3-phosphate transport system substrate-binding protein